MSRNHPSLSGVNEGGHHLDLPPFSVLQSPAPPVSYVNKASPTQPCFKASARTRANDRKAPPTLHVSSGATPTCLRQGAVLYSYPWKVCRCQLATSSSAILDGAIFSRQTNRARRPDPNAPDTVRCFHPRGFTPQDQGYSLITKLAGNQRNPKYLRC